jgi:hypothetical protein
VPCMTVPVRTLNCLRQDQQRQMRRSLIPVPPLVLRLIPFMGRM